jgi:integrase
VKPEHIQIVYNRLLARKVGRYAILKAHDALRSALSYAVKIGVIPRNPASVVITPKAPETEMQILDEGQVNQLLMTARGNRWHALIQLAVTTGMRQMELLGLRWVDLDWTAGTLKIERQLLRPHGVGIEFASTKTKFGRRTVKLGSKTIEVLREHYRNQQEDRKAAGPDWQEYGLIFTNHQGGPANFRNVFRDYKKLLEQAGLPPIRFHDLRHTAASLMLNHNVPVIVVSRRLGHAKPSITLDIYGHLIPTIQNDVAELMDDMVTPIVLVQTESV